MDFTSAVKKSMALPQSAMAKMFFKKLIRHQFIISIVVCFQKGLFISAIMQNLNPRTLGSLTPFSEGIMNLDPGTLKSQNPFFYWKKAILP